MTNRKTLTTTAATPAAWLQPHRDRFLNGLSEQGYAGQTLRTYDTAIARFCVTMAERGITAGGLDGRQLERLLSAVLASVRPSVRVNTKFCLDRFISSLAEAGVARLPKPPQKPTTALERLRTEYETYLRDQRGLAEATICHCARFLERFMEFRFGMTLGNLDDIEPHDIVAFLRKIMGRAEPYRDKTPPTHLRNLFRFLFWSGKTKRDLATSLPRVATPRHTHLPRSLKPEEVEKLIDAVWSADAIGRRNYAMLLVLARLGLRAPEVIAIQLEDIDWRAGTILIRGKGKRHDRMPLPEDVGKAIVDYLRKGRRGPSRTLFVSNRVPYRPFVDAQILNSILVAAFEQTGLTGELRHAGYIENWLDLLRHDDRAMFTAASKASQAADYLRSFSETTAPH